MARILIMRLSALGDVAMTVPVVTSLALQYPQLEITVLSREQFRPLFNIMPANVSFIGGQFNNKHRGIEGLNRLYAELKPMKFDYVADFHDVLRTKYLRMRFAMTGAAMEHIDKDRKAKRRLTRRDDKVLVSLKSSFRRYADVLENLGFPILLNFTSIYGQGTGDFKLIEPIVGARSEGETWLGIAPFAKHKGKIYPLEKQEKVVAHFANRPNTRVFLFGGGADEKAIVDGWVAKYPSLTSLIGKLSFDQELNVISHLDLMLSMDSANMHLASIVNTPVVSIWGATHPYAGFLGWKQLPVNCVQLDMSCRPCSIFGDKPCFRGDYACMYDITPEQVIEKVEGVLT